MHIRIHCTVGTKYNVQGIPCLIVLDANDGSILDTEGRKTVVEAVGNINKALHCNKWVLK
jgi:ABC-type protease/lipase transport system fused ATPase/permease subunit